jgi:hypothetical protein
MEIIGIITRVIVRRLNVGLPTGPGSLCAEPLHGSLISVGRFAPAYPNAGTLGSTLRLLCIIRRPIKVSRVKVAIVTTLRDAGSLLDSFVTYHLKSGFAHLFLFFDDPSDQCLLRFAGHPMVTTISHDDRLLQSWSRLPEYQAYAEFIGREVMARQVLNVALAMELARENRFDWLLHIDVDELFFTPKRTAMEHFSLAQSQPAETICYQNFEAVPEKVDITDPFREVDLFKIPVALGAGPFTEAGHALLEDTPQIPAKRFHFYRNGKSAVRLNVRDLHPCGVHGFKNWTRTTARVKARDGFILHYPCCGFDAFWRKYLILGAFADSWLDSFDIRSAIGPLHLDARDIVATRDRDTARDFYRQRIAIEDTERVELLIRQGILKRLPQPRELLNRVARSAGK